jgi:hypothetical protein
MKRVNSTVRPLRGVRQPRTTRRAGVKLRTTVDRQHQENLVAASIILGDVARYGGESAGLVCWARLVVKRASECAEDIDPPPREVQVDIGCPTCGATANIVRWEAAL